MKGYKVSATFKTNYRDGSAVVEDDTYIFRTKGEAASFVDSGSGKPGYRWSIVGAATISEVEVSDDESEST